MKYPLFCIFLFLFLPGCLTLDSFLFNPEPLEQYALPNNTIPDSLIQDVSFTSGTHKLYGFWVKSDGTRPGMTILYCHGNKHNIDYYWDRVMLLHQTGMNVFVFDYRGYGMSEGESSENGLHADGLAALNYIRGRYGVQDDSLCIYGYSLGNVVSIYLAAIDSVQPLGLVAECPFASGNSLTQGSAGLNIPPLWLSEGDFNNAENIRKNTSPFLLFHGEKDDFVQYRDNGKIVHNNANNPKKMILLTEANHSDIPEIMGEQTYIDSLVSWIETVK